jgi:hypothetical protein
MSKARNLSDFISDPAIDSTEIGSSAITTDKINDQAVTPAKLHNTLDLSSKTVTLPTDGISGNSIHGGVISNFASTGIDDNASSTAVTIDSNGRVGIGTGSPNTSLDLSSKTDAIGIPSGTTAQRPGSAAAGYTRFNTESGTLEFFDGSTWIGTNLIPTVDSVTGAIYAGAASDLTVVATNATDIVTVRFSESGSTIADVENVNMTTGSASVAVPAGVYGQSAGDTIEVSILNQDGTPSSNSVTKIVAAIPTGGTITTFGGYRVHTFTSGGNFVIPSGFSRSYDYMIVAGGGGAGQHAGGGGAGGLVWKTSQPISAGTYTANVGAGGATFNTGANSTFNGDTALGGGGGTNSAAGPGGSGGSGAGAHGGGTPQSGGSGLQPGSASGGFGNDGADGTLLHTAGGGAGSSPPTLLTGGAGKDMSSYFGTGIGESGWFAGGGGAPAQSDTCSNSTECSGGSGGQGGGGDGGAKPGFGDSSTNGDNGVANTGGGGGGSARNSSSVPGIGGAGGSGIVVIRYVL